MREIILAKRMNISLIENSEYRNNKWSAEMWKDQDLVFVWMPYGVRCAVNSQRIKSTRLKSEVTES